jgi:hypothetical protein
MIEQQLANLNFVGRDGFVWWIGHIPTESTWKDNTPGKRTQTTDEHKGFGYRYKVRILGYHPQEKDILSDDDLPWADVMLPVTAGSGSGGSSQTPNLKQGNFVYGFFLDGENAQVPIIMGVIGYNQYTSISKNSDLKLGYTPFGGFSPTDYAPAFVQPTTPENGNTASNSNFAIDRGMCTVADKEQYVDGSEKEYIPSTSDCEPIPLRGILLAIQNLIKKIEKLKKKLDKWKGLINEKINNIQKEINKVLDDAAKWITGGIKWIINKVQEFVTKKINNALKDTYSLIFPDQRTALKDAVETANDLIACLFKKIIKNLLGMVLAFLLQIVDRFINTPLCAIENFVGGLIGTLMGLITSALNSILGPISSIVGIVFDIGDSIIGFVTKILSFLSCDERPECSELKTWSTWGGAASGSITDIQNIINKVKSVASTFTQAIDPNNFDFIKNLNFDNLFSDTCNVGPLFCGPPTIEFIGGGGSGATANAIISNLGQILGGDILSSGFGYTSAPIVRFVDNCGKGNGAVGTAVLGDVLFTDDNGEITTTTGVVDIIIDDPGSNYLPESDGSLGGDGRTWANPEDTIIKRSDGTYVTPYVPGSIIDINPGDTVQLPGQDPYQSTISETISSPPYNRNADRGDGISSGDGKYPVALEIKDIIIDENGFGYNPGDKIVITPDNGAIATPVFSEIGELINVDLISGGYGFKEYPSIYIESDTGYNARLIPLFNIISMGQNNVPDEFTSGDNLISVVDCVGKF